MLCVANSIPQFLTDDCIFQMMDKKEGGLALDSTAKMVFDTLAWVGAMCI